MIVHMAASRFFWGAGLAISKKAILLSPNSRGVKTQSKRDGGNPFTLTSERSFDQIESWIQCLTWGFRQSERPGTGLHRLELWE